MFWKLPKCQQRFRWRDQLNGFADSRLCRDRSLPVAKLVPFSGEEASDEELLLVAAGKMRLPTGPLDIDELLSIPTGKVSGNRAIQALLDERTRDCEQRALVLGLERLGAAVRR